MSVNFSSSQESGPGKFRRMGEWLWYCNTHLVEHMHRQQVLFLDTGKANSSSAFSREVTQLFLLGLPKTADMAKKYINLKYFYPTFKGTWQLTETNEEHTHKKNPSKINTLPAVEHSKKWQNQLTPLPPETARPSNFFTWPGTPKNRGRGNKPNWGISSKGMLGGKYMICLSIF